MSGSLVETLGGLPLAEQEVVAQRLSRALALRSPLDFAQYVDETYPRLPVLEVINEYLMAAFNGHIRKLMINVPPRSGKSDLISRKTIAFLKCAMPDRNVMLASYGADLAEDHSREARAIIEAHPEFGQTLDPKSKAVDRWKTLESRGEVFALGVGGAITGRGVNIGIIDDPVKNAEDAASQRKRDAAWDWYNGTFRTRMQFSRSKKQWCVIVVMTRWHEDDLGGRLLREEGEWHPELNPDGWVVVRVPAFCDDVDDDPLGRQLGEPFQRLADPSSEVSGREFEALRRANSYVFSAQYQGRPMQLDGALFKSPFRYWRSDVSSDGRSVYRLDDGRVALIDACPRFTTVDLAASMRSRADWTVVSHWAVVKPESHVDARSALLLVNRVRVRLEAPDHLALVLEEYNKFRPAYVGVDSSTYGLSLLTDLKRAGVPTRELKNDTDKIARAIPAASRCQSGDVFFPAGVPWLDEWESELLGFPLSTYDDQVDTLSYAVREFVQTWSLMAAAREQVEQTRWGRWVSNRLAQSKGSRHGSPLGR